MASLPSARSQSFLPAAVGTRVRIVTLVTLVVVVTAIALIAVMVPRASGEFRMAMVGVGATFPVLAAYWFGARIRDYRISDGTLFVVRPFHTARFPLEGLVSARRDREAMAGAWKRVGNDGLGAIAGRFRSKKLGKFRAYVTDAESTVVLRWPDRCLVVSPEEPKWFVEALRPYCAEKGAA